MESTTDFRAPHPRAAAWWSRLLAISAAIAAGALPLAGCTSPTSQTPAQAVYDTETALDAVLAGLDTAHAAGLISAADEQKLAPYVNAAAAALSSLQAGVASNDSVSVSQALAAFDAAMQQLAAAKAQIPALATTAPSSR